MPEETAVGVIMAAGKGTRMEPFSYNIPKPLLPICNVPLIEHHIAVMKSLSVSRIFVVVGHLSFEIARRLGDGTALGVEITYVEQKENLGIAHAVGKLEPHITSRFLLFLGDIYFEGKAMERMTAIMESGKSSAVLAVVNEKIPEAIKRNFAVLTGDDGKVKRVIEKPRYVTGSMKGCGIYLFDQHIFDAIRRTPRTAMRDEYELTEAVQILIEDGYPVHAADVITADINLTYPQDLLEANLMHLQGLSRDSLVGRNVVLSGSTVIRSIIGDDVVLTSPVRVDHSVIMDGTVVNTNVDLEYAVVTADGILDLRRYFHR